MSIETEIETETARQYLRRLGVDIVDLGEERTVEEIARAYGHTARLAMGEAEVSE